MAQSNSASSTNQGDYAARDGIGGSQVETGAGKLADRSPAALEEATRPPDRGFLKKNAANLLRREHVKVSDMEDPAEPVKPVHARKVRKK